MGRVQDIVGLLRSVRMQVGHPRGRDDGYSPTKLVEGPVSCAGQLLNPLCHLLQCTAANRRQVFRAIKRKHCQPHIRGPDRLNYPLPQWTDQPKYRREGYKQQRRDNERSLRDRFSLQSGQHLAYVLGSLCRQRCQTSHDHPVPPRVQALGPGTRRRRGQQGFLLVGLFLKNPRALPLIDYFFVPWVLVTNYCEGGSKWVTCWFFLPPFFFIGSSPRDHEVQNDPQGVDVGSFRCRLSTPQLWRHVSGSASHLSGGHTLSACETEIGNDGAAAAILVPAQNDVSAFQVAMDDAAVVGLCQSGT